MTRVGLFGGSFDPIHLGHLAVAAAAKAQAGLDEVWFVPSRLSPHKQDLPPAPDLDRWAMVVLATLEDPSYRAVRWDLEREGPSYTVDTLRIARAELGSDHEFYWIMGADNLLSLPRWHDVPGILALASLLVIPRADLQGAALQQVKEALPSAYQSRISLLEMEPVSVSSTAVRERLQAGMPIDGLVPRLTMAYIERYNLFRPAARIVLDAADPTVDATYRP